MPEYRICDISRAKTASFRHAYHDAFMHPGHRCATGVGAPSEVLNRAGVLRATQVVREEDGRARQPVGSSPPEAVPIVQE